MLTAGPVPFASPPASQDPNDQEPFPFPTSTGELGPMAQFLSEMPDIMEGIEESLQRALDSLLVPAPIPPQMALASMRQFR